MEETAPLPSAFQLGLANGSRWKVGGESGLSLADWSRVMGPP